jgi:hypothetical protein
MNKKELYKLISAFIMGDGGVYYSGKNCRYVRNQLEKHRDYLLWQQEVLSNVTECNISNPILQEGKQPLLRIMTHTHSLFTKIRKRVYIGNYKSIDPHYLKLLDWEMLACLYMDDGSLGTEKRTKQLTYYPSLYTKRLSYGDNLLFKKALKDILDLEFNIGRHYDYYYLRLRQKDADKFLKGVEPYIFDSFLYKLPCS